MGTTLSELDLSSNFLRDDSIEMIGEVLLRTRLEKFGLDDNFLTDEAAKEFLKMLQAHEDLQLVELRVENNDMSALQKTQVGLFVRANARELAKKQKQQPRRRSRSGSRRGSGRDTNHSATRRASTQSGGRRASTLSVGSATMPQARSVSRTSLHGT